MEALIIILGAAVAFLLVAAFICLTAAYIRNLKLRLLGDLICEEVENGTKRSTNKEMVYGGKESPS
jgi:hypothetical protein